MHCPYCSSEDTRVLDSRDAEAGAAVRRRRQCSSCERRFTTFERIEELPLIVWKRDGTREPFDRAKVISGISKACKNRPVPDERMLALTDEIEEELRRSGNEVASTEIGREILGRLREVDEVAYLRFASVYRGFENVTDFQKAIRELEKTSPPKRRRSTRKGVSAAAAKVGPHTAGSEEGRQA